ncbi:SRPBCC family protein [bacterium]|nr:SRPBCC family protein [bacterium]
MYHLHVAMTFDATAEAVFDQIADHAVFLTGKGLVCQLVKEGSPDRNGRGAVREVKAGSMLFSEEILEFDRPRRFDYKIVSAMDNGKPTPLDHERGWLTFEQVGTQTRVDWHTRFRVKVPVLGWFAERFFIARTMKPKFLKLLEQARQRVEHSSASRS